MNAVPGAPCSPLRISAPISFTISAHLVADMIPSGCFNIYYTQSITNLQEKYNNKVRKNSGAVCAPRLLLRLMFTFIGPDIRFSVRQDGNEDCLFTASEVKSQQNIQTDREAAPP